MNSDLLTYAVAAALFGLSAGAMAFFLWRINEGSLPKWEKIPRSRKIGIILVVADLIWCVPHAKPLLPESLHMYFWPAIFVSAWLSYAYLDYLLARALGGFLILMAHYMLHESFSFHTPLTPALSALCYVFGVAGIFFAGKPHLLRDFFRKCAREPKFRLASVCYLALLCASCLGAGAWHVFGR